MKNFLKIVLITGAAFGIPMGTLAGIAIGIARGTSVGVFCALIVAIASGIAFGLGMGAFMTLQRRRFAPTRPEFAGEELLHDGPANHFLNGEGVGGWLFLTKERLLFRSHAFNIQCHELSVPLSDIAEIQAVRTAKLFANGLRLVTRDGKEERFVVEAHKTWRDEIVRQKNSKADCNRTDN
jgi:hypothetical protein